MKYSLVNIYKEHAGGFVDGVWLQDVNGNFDEALKAARLTEIANSNRITVAVVNGLTGCVPDFSFKKKLRRLDIIDS